MKNFLGYWNEPFSNETRYTPPGWARHFISWKMLGWLDRHLDTCWASMVMWKLGNEFADNWWPCASCFKPYDYCGKYNGKPQPEIPWPVYVTFKEKAAVLKEKE